MKIQNIIKVITIGVFVCVAGLFFYLNQNQQEEGAEEVLIASEDAQESQNSTIENTPKKTEAGKEKKKSIFVHICGAIKKAGVYELKEGSRICDAIKAAGGFKKTANQTFLNQAQVLSDGEQVVVPVKENTEKNVQNMEEMPASQNTQKVSINHATCEELMTLPGIGESKANSIIKFREENGGFQTLEDLKKIQGIKDGVYSKIADYIML
ncbi:MAG: helix-hairpin-helix domain-containing protein [Lachnospiraceae bacterium]|nr:helix-hairpin-helix domain-containing protein [Lachnospiraceae bacterium]